MANRRNRKLVPGCEQAIDQWKYEIAGELGVTMPGMANGAGFDSEMAGELGAIGGSSGGTHPHYWGDYTARQMGSIGGHITRKLIQQAEQTAQPAIL